MDQHHVDTGHIDATHDAGHTAPHPTDHPADATHPAAVDDPNAAQAPEGFTVEQTDAPTGLQHDTARDPRFGHWETNPSSGTMWERAPDGSYTGNWGY
jgi:hypothetical protein